MSGWRDADGRTAAERRKQQGAQERARLAETLRYRPMSLVRPLLGAGFVAVLVIAIIAAYG